jgi:hypothetical protein
MQAQIILHAILLLGYISIIGYNEVTFHSGPTQWQLQIPNMTGATTRTIWVICSSATVQNSLNFATSAIAEATGTHSCSKLDHVTEKKKKTTQWVAKTEEMRYSPSLIEWLILTLIYPCHRACTNWYEVSLVTNFRRSNLHCYAQEKRDAHI